MSTLDCLLVIDGSSRFASVSYYQCWRRAFERHPGLATKTLDVSTLRSAAGLRTAASLLLTGRYDLVVCLPSVMWHIDGLVWKALAPLLARRSGEKVVFFVNEYRFLYKQIDAAKAAGATAIASQFPEDVAKRLYGAPRFGGRILSMPNAVDPDVFHPDQPWHERTVDVGFRGDPYPVYLGHDDREAVTGYFQANAQRLGISADIVVSRDERLDETAWNAFLNRCKALIGHEAGASLIDVDDVYRKFFLLAHEQAPEPVMRKLVAGVEASGFYQHAVSGRIAAPRHLECLATQTVQILLPGRYNDLIEPDTHYIPLSKDFSNAGAVVEKLRDRSFCEALIERGREHVLSKHLYRHRVDALLSALGRTA